MTSRDRKTLLAALACAAALCALGLWAVLAQAQPARVAAFADRFADLSALGFAAPEGVALTTEADRLRVTWPAGSAAVTVQSQPVPLAGDGARLVRADAYAGGTKNADGRTRTGFRAWLSLDLLRAGQTVATGQVELLLESDKERTRRYALAVPCENAAPDAYRLRLTLEPLDGALAEGTLECAWLEVTPQ